MSKIIKPPLPLSVILPIPSAIPRARGIYSTEQFGHASKVRITLDEYQLIMEQCALLDMKLAPFFRWSGVEMAKALAKYTIIPPNPQGDTDNV